jgi:hypothetical protein
MPAVLARVDPTWAQVCQPKTGSRMAPQNASRNYQGHGARSFASRNQVPAAPSLTASRY